MSTAVAAAPTRNAETSRRDLAPVEKAVADSIAGDFGPETFLWIDFHRPDGGVKIWYAWTAGGEELGDRIDSIARATRLDSSDWLHIADRHEMVTTRGRVKVKAYPLRPVLADVQGDVRAPEELRDWTRRLLRAAAEVTGQVPHTLTPRWLGFGPRLLEKKGGAW